MKNKIDENTMLETILKDPKLENVLSQYKVPCLVCPFAAMEMGELKIGPICKKYGIDIKSLIIDLNKVLN